MHDVLDLALTQTEIAIRDEADARIAACRAYVEHLREGGDPTVLAAWHPPAELEKAKSYTKALCRAWREATGQPLLPVGPNEGRRYKAVDALLNARAQGAGWMTFKELNSILDGQVEARLQVWRLDGYELEKDKIDGKVAYRLVATE